VSPSSRSALSRASSRSARLPVAARLTAVAAAAAIGASLAGCSTIDHQLNKQIAVVRFRPGTTVATVYQARQACAHLPGLQLLPPHVHPGNPTSAIALRYNANQPTQHDIAALEGCLQKFPDVTGVAFMDSAGRGI
jgi:hypothetical protein